MYPVLPIPLGGLENTMRKALFAILALLCFAVCVRADTLTFQDGEIIIPDGSTVISSVTEDTGATATPENLVTFSFADGTGFAGGDFNDGDGGTITFTVPVTSLTISWIATGEEWAISTNGGGPVIECQSMSCGTMETLTFTGVITSIGWSNFAGFSGIESMSYTVATPEPGALVLLAIGLGSIVGLKRYRFRKGRPA
jgi:hypothetical protein